MRRMILPLSVVLAFVGGARLARGAGDDVLKELLRHEELLLKDLAKIEQACKDVLEIRKMRESGEFVLNEEEKKLERQGREDFHIFMERIRNDTLEVLEILDRAVNKQDYVDPLRRIYGKALDQPVAVAWSEEDLDVLIGEISGDYGVEINISGDLDRRRTLSLNGEMSLLAVLLQIENVFDGRFVVKEDGLWFVLRPVEETAPGPDKRPPTPTPEPPPKDAKPAK